MAIPSSNRNAIQTQIKVDNAAHATTADSATTAISASIATTASYALTTSGTVTNATSASYAATASVLLGNVISASYALTASYAMNGGSGGSVDTSSLVTTSSFNTFTSSIQGQVTSLTNATSSYVQNSQTSSFVKNNQTSSFITNSQTSSMSVLSASYSYTTDHLNTVLATSPVTLYPVLTTDIGGDKVPYIDGDLSFNPSTNTLNVTASYASSGPFASQTSNQFNGNQTITGSVLITQNLTVLGSSSITYITASQLAVSASYISVNVFEPAQRFGGLYVYDSGSSNATASLTWDSQNNHWIYSNASGSTYTGGGLISGPRNTGSLGSETYPTQNRVVKGQGGDHITDSNITDNGTIVSINSNTQITGSLTVTQGITGSLFGTASQANNALTSDYATNAGAAGEANFSHQVDTVQNTSLGPGYLTFVDSDNGSADKEYIYTAPDIYYDTNTQTLTVPTFAGNLQGTADNATSASYAATADNATTSSYVNPLNQNIIISGSAIIGSSSLGPNENTLTLGARDAVNEGGQIGFNAPGGTYTSASFIDLYQNRLRILKGTNASSTGEVANWSMHSLQMSLPAYTSATAFNGSVVASLGVDIGGNVLTTMPFTSSYLINAQTTAAGTDTTINNLTFTTSANQAWAFEAAFVGQCSGTGGVRFTVVYSAVPVSSSVSYWGNSTQVGNMTSATTILTTPAQSGTMWATATPIDVQANIRACFVNAGSANTVTIKVQPQNGAQTATIRAMAYLTARRIS